MTVAMRGGRSVLNLTLSPIVKVRLLIQSRTAEHPVAVTTLDRPGAERDCGQPEGGIYESGES
jgi:hypothetical protein